MDESESSDFGQPWTSKGPMVLANDNTVICLCGGSLPIAKLTASFIVDIINKDFNSDD